MIDDSRFGNTCGSWRPVRHIPGADRDTIPRATCTRPYHPHDPVHYTARRDYWWTRTDQYAKITSDTPIPERTPHPLTTKTALTNQKRTP